MRTIATCALICSLTHGLGAQETVRLRLTEVDQIRHQLGMLDLDVLIEQGRAVMRRNEALDGIRYDYWRTSGLLAEPPKAWIRKDTSLLRADGSSNHYYWTVMLYGCGISLFVDVRTGYVSTIIPESPQELDQHRQTNNSNRMTIAQCQVAAEEWMRFFARRTALEFEVFTESEHELGFRIYEVHNGFRVEESARVTVARHRGQLLEARLPTIHQSLDYSTCYGPMVSPEVARQAAIAAYGRYHPYASAQIRGPAKIAGYSFFKVATEYTSAQKADLASGRALPYYRFVIWDDGAIGLPISDARSAQFWDVDARNGHAMAVSVIPGGGRGSVSRDATEPLAPSQIEVDGTTGELKALGPSDFSLIGRPIVVAHSGERLVTFYWIAEKWLLVAKGQAYKPEYDLLRPIMRSARLPGTFKPERPPF